MDQPQQDQNQSKTRQLKGLYRGVNVSVKALNVVIVLCILAILIVVFVDLQSPGFTVTFDSRGGTDVASQTQQYGELLNVPEDPTREGYTFTGWYRDSACYELWNLETDTIETDMTLYAGWEKTE